MCKLVPPRDGLPAMLAQVLMRLNQATTEASSKSLKVSCTMRSPKGLWDLPAIVLPRLPALFSVGCTPMLLQKRRQVPVGPSAWGPCDQGVAPPCSFGRFARHPGAVDSLGILLWLKCSPKDRACGLSGSVALRKLWLSQGSLHCSMWVVPHAALEASPSTCGPSAWGKRDQGVVPHVPLDTLPGTIVRSVAWGSCCSPCDIQNTSDQHSVGPVAWAPCSQGVAHPCYFESICAAPGVAPPCCFGDICRALCGP